MMIRHGRPHLHRAPDAGYAAKVIEQERPDGLIGTLGGQTAEPGDAVGPAGVLDRYHVELLERAGGDREGGGRSGSRTRCSPSASPSRPAPS